MAQTSKQLQLLVDSLANQPFHNIQKLRGRFQFPHYDFQFIKIQGSPGANPASIATIKVSISASELPDHCFASQPCRLALADYLIRRFKLGIEQYAQQNRGRDGSGSFHTIALSQKMLERDSVLFSIDEIECRFIFSLPAKGSGGGQFDAEQTWYMFEQELNAIVDYALYYKNYDKADKQLLAQFLDIQLQRQEIHHYMQQHKLCVFINSGACLPRQSGIDDKPANNSTIKLFKSPKNHQVKIPLSGNRSIQGMGIKEGITCITGGGYHGKSTLLQAILAGVYAHIPGDGRELVVTREDAVFIRAEEGRSIRKVDISPFIGQLPNGLTTEQFSTDNASGSTSQAAAIVEALESNSRLLLFDEDTCATNFLLRDELIKKVLDSKKEPIKPLYTTMRSLWKQQNVSMVFVVGGLGSFLQKADTCLLMDNYKCQDITAKVRQELGHIIEEEENKYHQSFSVQRHLSANNFNPSYTNKRLKKTVSKRIKDLRNAPKQLEYGMDLINLEALPQIVEAPQVLCIGYCLLKLRIELLEQKGNEALTIENCLEWLYQNMEQQGLSFLKADYPGTLSLPRKYDLAAAINRIRSLQITTEALYD